MFLGRERKEGKEKKKKSLAEPLFSVCSKNFYETTPLIAVWVRETKESRAVNSKIQPVCAAAAV